MPKFEVFEQSDHYTHRAHQFVCRRATFHRTTTLLGVIDAYMTTIRRHGDMGDPALYLDIPGCPDSRLTAREAVEHAKAGRYGLSWEPAAAARPQRPGGKRSESKGRMSMREAKPKGYCSGINPAGELEGHCAQRVVK